jgi:dienelactone hydrolase
MYIPLLRSMAGSAAAMLLSLPATAQNLVFPSSSSIDRAVPVRVSGLPPGSRVTLRIGVTDSDGQYWAARADFRADSGGRIDTGRDTALAGSYTGVEAAGLFTHAAAVGDSGRLRRFQSSGLGPIASTIVVEDANGRALDSVTVQRFFLAPGITVTPVAREGFVGRLFLPEQRNAPGIVVLGGSEGGYPDGLAALLATNGFAALSLAYFGAEGLPSELREIPLDRVAHAIEWLRAQPGVRSDRVALFGTSKGAEAALLVASRVPTVSAVVAYAPSSVAWSCICNEQQLPSWTYAGRPVTSVPPGTDPAYRPVPGEPLRPTVHYRHRLLSAPPGATIPVERIAGPLFLVAGSDDQLWPSLAMAEAIVARRAGSAGHPDDQLLSYPNAGHLIAKAYIPSGSTRLGRGSLPSS